MTDCFKGFDCQVKLLFYAWTFSSHLFHNFFSLYVQKCFGNHPFSFLSQYFIIYCSVHTENIGFGIGNFEAYMSVISIMVFVLVHL